MENGLRATIERYKLRAERLLTTNKRAFIIDIDSSYYFCDILFVGEESIRVNNFKGKLEGTKSTIYWEDVLKIEEYKERSEL